ncbi:hypothetical protein PPL_06284 [Heterostelium album PN500]|uniref:Uncharacterized protein n=1 Tax=Heterostelium pallidum (strain ATCC 26659 / Pp 5 / PN500) TaxID=670386 RepID=D3BCQ8_HETP5|nr:hypothetical protein PPL_06284 [Heterostelium album PN500]EFA80700.1 hypothetical protein PPL_06284 [Heterostelium album PN500]|eukprot:XP_020432820.1 hypothetical protein PPL_06284 [Heterostelium album PN500]
MSTTSTASLNNQEDDLYEDALPIFKDALKDMKLGQLVHPKQFTLDQAIHALEVMNKKLDTGSDVDRPFTAEMLYDMGEVPRDTSLNTKEIIAIIDRLMSYEIGWIEGNPIAFTLFNCMYLHFPGRLKNNYLSTYISGLLASSDTLIHIVSRGDVCVEEDFNLSTYDFNLNQNVDTLVLVNQLDALSKELLQMVDQLNEEKKTDEAIDMKDLYDRITFRRMFYVLFFSLMSSNVVMAQKLIPQIQKTLDSMRSRLPKLKLVDIPEGIFNAKLNCFFVSSMDFPAYQCHPFAKVLDNYDKLIRDLSTMLQMPHLMETHQQMKQQQQNQQQNQQQQQQQQSKSDLDLSSVLDYHLYFSRQSPNIIVRSLLRRLLFPLPSGQFFRSNSVPSAILEWMTSFGVPSQYLNLKNPEIAKFVERFSLALQRIFIQTSLNRARQHRKLKNSLFDLTILQSEADIIDTEIAKDKTNISILFGSFIFNIKLKLMIHYLYLGFELEIYEHHEYQQIYWYLDCLAALQIQVHHYIYKENQKTPQRTKKEEKKEAKKEAKKAAKKGSTNNNQKAAANNNHPKSIQQQQHNNNNNSNNMQNDAHLPPATPDRLLIASHKLTARSMFRFMTVLEMMGKIKKPKCEFSSPTLRFLKRFEHFNSPPYQQPEPYTLELFNQSIQVQDITAFGILLSTLENIKLAKQNIEHIMKGFAKPPPFYIIEEAKAILRTNITLSLVIQKLLPKNYETLSEKSEQPIPVGNVTFEPRQCYPNIIWK